MVFRNILRMKGLKCTRANKRLIWFYDVPIQYLYEKKKEKKCSFYDELAKLKTAILEEVSENNYGIFKESLTFSHLR